MIYLQIIEDIPYFVSRIVDDIRNQPSVDEIAHAREVIVEHKIAYDNEIALYGPLPNIFREYMPYLNAQETIARADRIIELKSAVINVVISAIALRVSVIAKRWLNEKAEL